MSANESHTKSTEEQRIGSRGDHTVVKKINMPLGDSRKSQNKVVPERPEQKAFLCGEREELRCIYKPKSFTSEVFVTIFLKSSKKYIFAGIYFQIAKISISECYKIHITIILTKYIQILTILLAAFESEETSGKKRVHCKTHETKPLNDKIQL